MIGQRHIRKSVSIGEGKYYEIFDYWLVSS